MVFHPPSISHAPSPGKMLVSTGCSEDGHMGVWDWRTGLLLARQPLLAGGGIRACFTEDGSCLISTGKEHFKVGERACVDSVPVWLWCLVWWLLCLGVTCNS